MFTILLFALPPSAYFWLTLLLAGGAPHHICLYVRFDDLRAASASGDTFKSALTTVSFTFVDYHEDCGFDYTHPCAQAVFAYSFRAERSTALHKKQTRQHMTCSAKVFASPCPRPSWLATLTPFMPTSATSLNIRARLICTVTSNPRASRLVAFVPSTAQQISSPSTDVRMNSTTPRTEETFS
jgi:hypothetical protein